MFGNNSNKQNRHSRRNKSRLNMANIVATILFRLLSSRIISKYVNFKILKTAVLHVVLYGCETSSLME
jgi:predicted component of type VI protein secretion system